MISIAFTVSCRRPRYLHRCLDSWSRARGIEDARLVLSLEPVLPRSIFPLADLRAYLERAFPGRAELHVSQDYLGCARNTRKAITAGFEHSDFTVMAEEDIEVADDALEYFAWARDAYAGDSQVLTVCANTTENGDGTEGSVLRAQWFSPLVWGTWRDRWEEVIVPEWTTDLHGWDGTLRTLVAQRDYRCVYPAYSRAAHFGAKSTLTPGQANGRPNFFYNAAASRCYRQHYDPQQYQEAQVEGAVLY